MASLLAGLYTPLPEGAEHITAGAYVWKEQESPRESKSLRHAGRLTDWILLSDHGQLEISESLRLNALFAQNGLLDLDAHGKVSAYRAYAHTCGMSAQIYLHEPDDPRLIRQVEKLITQNAMGANLQILRRQEAQERYGLDGTFSLIVETDGKLFFDSDPNGPVLEKLVNQDNSGLVATHGHMPEKGPQPPFLAAGPSFAQLTQHQGNILDIAPTLMALLDLPHEGTQGCVRWEWLAK